MGDKHINILDLDLRISFFGLAQKNSFVICLFTFFDLEKIATKNYKLFAKQLNFTKFYLFFEILLNRISIKVSTETVTKF